jgi:ATP-dependent DNA helicase RecG
MVETADGFEIARRDLEIRGPGQFFGTRQWGLADLRLGDILRDRDILEDARGAAFAAAEEAREGRMPALVVEQMNRRLAGRLGMIRVG